jgi:tRNA (guanine37-N1)-methyltransferase
MLKIDIVTVLPQLFNEHLNNLPFKRALIKNTTQINIWNLRDYALDSYGTVDDKPYGGGIGMILMVEPIYKVLLEIFGISNESSISPEIFVKTVLNRNPNTKIILTDPKGITYSQKLAQQYTSIEHLVIICGRYEGVDQRVRDNLVTDCVSIGNYVLSGGELPALVIMESLLRLLPGTLEKQEVLKEETFTQNEKDFEYPQYTRPENFRGAAVPDILLSGNHQKIEEWRNKHKKQD